MLCQEKKTTKQMGLNGTKNIHKFKSCTDELRLVFTSTCKALCVRKQANTTVFPSFCHLVYSLLTDHFLCTRLVFAQRELDKTTVPYHAASVPWSFRYGSGLHCARR